MTFSDEVIWILNGQGIIIFAGEFYWASLGEFLLNVLKKRLFVEERRFQDFEFEQISKSVLCINFGLQMNLLIYFLARLHLILTLVVIK